MDLSEEIVCLTLDGAGYGSDGKIWGGEVLLATYTGFERLARLEYIPLIGGDRAVENPMRVVFGIFEKLEIETDYFDDEAASVLRKALKNSPESCSFGRFLDAISCYLGVCCKKTYDGEPAIKLERYLNRGKKSHSFEGKITKSEVKVIETLPLFEELYSLSYGKTLKDQEKFDLAYSMVSAALEPMVEVACQEAIDRKIGKIGITGGVSYNLPIVRMVKDAVEERGLNLIMHNQVPNGDGGISMGQNAIAGNILEGRG
ncbi:MAG: hypothetical protein JSV09_00160 [Thermoplasmata archaeon]|nr:MAG: hypothetical protein JSV09_00160 [Thermoplasmata archaeon]